VTTVGITGHQKIPAEAEPTVREELSRHLARFAGDLVAVTSLAAGADQLFARLALSSGGTLHAVLPARDYAGTFDDPADLRQFRELLARARTVETLEFDRAGEDAYLAAGKRVAELSEILYAVWDGEPAHGRGGTADIVEYARLRGIAVEVIWPPGVRRERKDGGR
jgi:hypothetical protein